MPLQKQPVSVNFSQGLDLKTDPFQVSPGKFLSLQNSIFDKADRLTKRNGFQPLTALPDESSLFLTTFNGNLTAVGTALQAYSENTNTWVNKGVIQPLELNILPLIRSNLNQSQADSTVASNGLVCTVFTDNPPSGLVYKYVIADSITGQNIVPPTLIPAGIGIVTGSPRVFLLGNYFIVMFTNVITSVSHLQYIAINISNPTNVTIPADIASSYEPSPTLSFDAILVGSNLYIAYDTLAGGQSIRVTYLSSGLVLITPKTFAGQIATIMSMSADITNPAAPIIYASYYDLTSHTGNTFAVDKNLNTVLAPTLTIASGTILNLTSVAQNGICTIGAEVSNNYGYDTSVPTHFIAATTITQLGVVAAPVVVVRSLGLASKAFIYKDEIYFLGIYFSVYQPTYFLINQIGQVICKLAYSNGPQGYYTVGLPNATLTNNVAQIAYLDADLIEAVNKVQGAPVSTGVYSQTGINLASFTIGTTNIQVAELGSDLNISGGYLGMYDGYTPVEQGFFLWPDNVEAVASPTGGTMSAQQYFYQATYEWSDNQGNVFRSAPSIPITVTTTSAISSVTIFVPTLRLTYKLANPVKISIYRWSAAQETYYQVTSIEVPVLNDTTVDYITYVDMLSDDQIIGNNIIYTNGGVLEDIAAPATKLMTLFDNRLWLVDAEDQNLLWYSKQVIESVPVEMSDLLTVYVAPTTSAQGSTGPITALSAMDDKLIIFKKDAIYYLNGSGPDNTGANSQYSQPTFISSTVGCALPSSIVFTPNGLMFQSDKGIWSLGRDLNTTYIGAPVETLTTGAIVESALNVAGTNQIRFTMNSGITLMYDYYFAQWGTFVNIPAISSVLYKGLHTYLNSFGQVFQETPGAYLDNTSPVLMSFTTNWMNLAGLQGFERFYQMYLLGQYITPFKLNVQLAYNYNPAIQQSKIVTPVAPSPLWGGDADWGTNVLWGGPPTKFEGRVFPEIQKCESFQVTINELYDPSFSIAAGAGLTLSGLNLVVGMKKGYRTQSASRSFG